MFDFYLMKSWRSSQPELLHRKTISEFLEYSKWNTRCGERLKERTYNVTEIASINGYIPRNFLII